MSLNLFHKYELGHGLEYNEGVNVKVDNSGNVQLEVSESGLKGVVELPVVPNTEELERKVVTLEESKEELTRTIEELRTDLTQKQKSIEMLSNKVLELESVNPITNLELIDNFIRYTLKDSSQQDINLDDFKNKSTDDLYQEMKNSILTDVSREMTGEEVQDFSGIQKGFLIKSKVSG